MSQYQKKHSPSHPSWSSTVLYQLPHLQQFIGSSLFNLRAWQSFFTTSLQVFFSLPLGLGPSTLYYIHFFTQVLGIALHTHTHTHLFNGPFSGTTRVSRYQKGNTNLDFCEARDSEGQWHQLGRMQVCTSLQTDNHASTPLLSFYRPDALPAAQPTASEHWRHCIT